MANYLQDLSRLTYNMPKTSKLHSLYFYSFLFANLFLTGCVSNPKNEHVQVTYDIEERSERLLATEKWQLRGKIAFIQKAIYLGDKEKRESASIAWQVNEKTQTQELNLTTYLGINMLNLKSIKNKHVIKVDGKEYRSADLPQLINSLTGLTLPTKALTYWLKGLPYENNDQLIIDEKTKLPKSISSNYHNTLWQINYYNYQKFNGLNFNNLNMATKFTIKKNDLLIKIAVNKWIFDD